MLNDNIRILRKAKGLSQEELSMKLNVVRQTVSKWEKGCSDWRQLPRLKSLGAFVKNFSKTLMNMTCQDSICRNNT